MDTTEALKGHIKQALAERGMSVLSLSQATLIPYSTLQRKLSERPQAITVEEVGNIAHVLNISPVDLFTGHTSPEAVAA